MADLWTDALQEAYAAAPADEYVVSTLELIHPAFVDVHGDPDSIRVALDNRDWSLTYEATAPLFAGQTKTFEALALTVALPAQTEGDMGSLTMTLDNVPMDIWPKLQAAATIRASALVIYREWVAVLSGGTYTPSAAPDLIIDQLTMKVVEANLLRLTGQASFVDLLNRSYPRRVFNRDDWPGLFGG